MQTKIVEAVFQGHMAGFKSRINSFKRALVRVLIRCGSVFKPICPRINSYCVYFAWHILPIGGGSWGDSFANDLLKLILQATAIANIADNAASSPLTNLFWSLHTADPQTGNQNTSEIAYTSYARVSVARSSGGFTITADVANPAANVDFPAGTGGSGTATHAAIGTVTSGTGKILISGTLTPNIVCGNGITPRIPTSSTITAS